MVTLSATTTGAVPVHEMVVIHKIFRREFLRLAKLVLRCPPGHVRRAAGVSEHADFLMAALHYHHETEDNLLWPLLLERARPQADLVKRMERQHEAVAERLAHVRDGLADWRSAPDGASGRAVSAAVADLTERLVEHLNDEERLILPIAAAHLTLAEWQRIGEQSFAKFSPAQKLIALGLLIDAAAPEEAVSFLAGLPWPIRAVWALSGRRRYRRYVARVDGRFDPTLRRWMRRANRVAVALYRRTGGWIGGSAKGAPVMLLTVAGRRTGLPRTVPVGFVPHAGGFVVAGTAGGSPIEPQWFGNVRAATTAEIQIGAVRQAVSCRVAGDEERDRLWRDVVVVKAPIFARYEARCGRPVPLAVLTPAPSDADHHGA